MANRIKKKEYGVVYTPDKLADFAAKLLYFEATKSKTKVKKILDPACGRFSLLQTAKKYFGEDPEYIGIDIDNEITNNDDFTFYVRDALIPSKKIEPVKYWQKRLGSVQAVIANPPWSSEHIYSVEELQHNKYELAIGQYDSYVLFIEFIYKILDYGGLFVCILPDSLFSDQNVLLRKFLVTNTQIKTIARLGEKIFPYVNRATTILVCKKEKPNQNTKTKCFRLNTKDRNEYLKNEASIYSIFKSCKHEVLQQRFENNINYVFDVDLRQSEEKLLSNIENNRLKLEEHFIFGRGVEISKTGNVVFCSNCFKAQGFNKKQDEAQNKKCSFCGADIKIVSTAVKKIIHSKKEPQTFKIYVGEQLHRYNLTNPSYIDYGVPGINYKNMSIYKGPKLLIRKTGLGIYAQIDYSDALTSQTIYTLKYRNKNIPIEYFLAIINSRVIYYYYLKKYGENEWKTHPYLTKEIIFSLPIKAYKGSKTDNKIVALCKKLIIKYSADDDLNLEKAIMEKYKLTKKEQKTIIDELNALPNLLSINEMKVEERLLV